MLLVRKSRGDSDLPGKVRLGSSPPFHPDPFSRGGERGGGLKGSGYGSFRETLRSIFG